MTMIGDPISEEHHMCVEARVYEQEVAVSPTQCATDCSVSELCAHRARYSHFHYESIACQIRLLNVLLSLYA